MRKVIANLLIFTISKVVAENCCRQQLVKGFIFVKVFIRSKVANSVLNPSLQMLTEGKLKPLGSTVLIVLEYEVSTMA